MSQVEKIFAGIFGLIAVYLLLSQSGAASSIIGSGTSLLVHETQILQGRDSTAGRLPSVTPRSGTRASYAIYGA